MISLFNHQHKIIRSFQYNKVFILVQLKTSIEIYLLELGFLSGLWLFSISVKYIQSIIELYHRSPIALQVLHHAPRNVIIL